MIHTWGWFWFHFCRQVKSFVCRTSAVKLRHQNCERNLPCFLRRTSSTSSWLQAPRAQWLQLFHGGIPGGCPPVHGTKQLICSRNNHQIDRHKLQMFFLCQIDLGIPAMTECCNQLDVCYDNCGINKYDCDTKFRSCLQNICSDLKRSLGFVSKVQGQTKRRSSSRSARHIQYMNQIICHKNENNTVLTDNLSFYFNG